MSDEIFREVDEEVKRERMLALWKEYGRFVVGVVVFVLAATASIVLWQNYREGQKVELSDRFIVANQTAAAGDIAGAIGLFEAIATEGADGYAMLSHFRQAALLAEQGETAIALEVYQAISGNSDYDATYRDFAVLLMGVTGASAPARSDVPALREQLAALAAQDSPFRYNALEVGAALALAEGDRAGAGELLKQLADSAEAPLGIRQRATELLRAIDG